MDLCFHVDLYSHHISTIIHAIQKVYLKSQSLAKNAQNKPYNHYVKCFHICTTVSHQLLVLTADTVDILLIAVSSRVKSAAPAG